jgi:hypothetical protein
MRHSCTRRTTMLAVLSIALWVSACGSSVPGALRGPRATGDTTSLPTASSTTAPGSASDDQPIETPYPTTTIVDWGNYAPSYNTIEQLYADSHYVFIATVGPLVQNDPAPGDTFAPFVVPTATFLASPATPPTNIALGIPQGQTGDVPLVVGHTYLIFFGIDYSDSPTVKTCIIGGQRGLFDYDATTQTVTRTDSNTSSSIPMTLTLAQMTSDIQSAEAAAPTDVGSASDPQKVPYPPVCALSATTS